MRVQRAYIHAVELDRDEAAVLLADALFAVEPLVAVNRDAMLPHEVLEDLLRDVLHGMNPGGRLYGYVGLKLLGRNTAEDDALYDRLTGLSVPIETCGGCMLGQAKASEVDLSGFEVRR